MKIKPNQEKKKEEIAKLIRARYTELMQEIVAPYQPEERETWALQVTEADAFLKGETDLPLITGIAAARGIPLDELVVKIKENDALFRRTIGELLGQQQYELDVLYGLA